MLSCLWASDARYRLIICTVLNCCSMLWLRSSWPGLLITVLSMPPALAASNTFSIVIGHLPFQIGAAAISGGMTWVWKSRIMGDLRVNGSDQATVEGQIEAALEF